MQNAAACILANTRKYDNITPVLRSLYWLPIQHRIKFKVLTIVFKIRNDLAPSYLCDLIEQYVPQRTLEIKSSKQTESSTHNSNLIMSCAFCVNGPRLWKALPSKVRSAASLNSFKSKLKTHLFSEYFNL